jgi:hypothetical protein
MATLAVSSCSGGAFDNGLRPQRLVAKRRDKPYRSGRSPDWIKVKNPDAPAATRVIEG